LTEISLPRLVVTKPVPFRRSITRLLLSPEVRCGTLVTLLDM